MSASWSTLLPAIILFSLIAVALAFARFVLLKLPEWKAGAKRSLSEKNIAVSDGRLTFAMKDVSNEEYMDKMQRAFVNTLSNSHTNPTDKHYRVRRWKNADGKMVQESLPASADVRRTSTL